MHHIIVYLIVFLIMASPNTADAQPRRESDPPVTKRSVTVSGVVYRDVDSDGRRAGDEAGLAGVMVSDGDRIFTTDADGRYEMTIDVDEFRFVFIVRPNGYRPVGKWNFLIPYDEATPGYEVDFALADDPTSRSGRDFTFIHTADSQFGSRRDGQWLKADFAELSQHSGAPAFLVISGDLVQTGYLEEWEYYADARSALTLPIYEVFGGHGGNYSEPDRSVGHFRIYCGPDWYAFWHGGVCFIVIDDLDGFMTQASRDRQQRWLSRFCDMLPEGTPIIATAHHPKPIDAFFARHRPIAFLHGHWHDNTLNYYRDVPYLCTGPIRSHDGGAMTRSYRMCHVRDGQLTTELRTTGQVRRLDVTSPQDGAAVQRQRGVLPLRVVTYNTPTYVQHVNVNVSGPDGAGNAIELKQLGQWTWGADWTITDMPAGAYTVQVTATDDTGAMWDTQHGFSLTDGTPPSASADEDWPMFFRQLGQVRSREAPLTPPLSLAWTVHTGGAAQDAVSPVIAGGRLFVSAEVRNPGDVTPALVCYDPLNGEQLWRRQLRTPVRFSPAATAERVFVQTSAGRVICFDAQTGEPRWQDELLAQNEQWRHHTAMGPILLYEDKVIAYLSNGPGRVYDAETGDITADLPAWPRQTFFSSPYPFNGKLYQPVTYYARCIDLVTGQLTWEQKLPVRSISTGVVVGDTFYISANGRVMRVSLEGTVDSPWRVSGGSTLRQGGVALSGSVMFAAAGALNAIDLASGENLWTFRTKLSERRAEVCRRQLLGMLSTPAVAGDTVYIGGEDGYIYALDASSGKVRWRWDTGVPVKGSPIISGNMLFVCDYDGNLWAFVGHGGSLTPPATP